jgi:hypothetical protein
MRLCSNESPETLSLEPLVPAGQWQAVLIEGIIAVNISGTALCEGELY